MPLQSTLFSYQELIYLPLLLQSDIGENYFGMFHRNQTDFLVAVNLRIFPFQSCYTFLEFPSREINSEVTFVTW
jgi:hypothetical protein